MLSDDLKTAKSVPTKLYLDMEAIRRLIKPSCLSVFERMKTTMDSTRRRPLAISRALEFSRTASRMNGIISANRHLQDVLKNASATSRMVNNFNVTHQSWSDYIDPIRHDFSYLQASALLARDVSLKLTATERFMASMDFDAIRNRFQIGVPAISDLECSITHVAASCRSLAESSRDIPDIMNLPNPILPGATREIYTTGLARETIRAWDKRDEKDAETEIQLITDAEQETAGCIAITLLQQVDPRFTRLYVGAHDALNGNNADRARHILISLRELWDHLLRRLAPDEFVLTWITCNGNQQELLDKGRPTRRARVLYVFRELNNDPLREFLTHDTRVLVKLIELFNRLHELEIELTDEQLRAILLKTELWLMYILKIWTGTLRKQI